MTSIAKGMTGLALVFMNWTTAPLLEGALAQKQSELFLAKALDLNARTLALAEKAVSNATRPEVKKFAQQMVDDHKQVEKDLLALASDTKIGVVTGLSSEHREALSKLTALKGDDFDRAFLTHMVRNHQEGIKLFETEGLKQAHEPCRAMADRLLPHMRKHLKEAQSLGGAASAGR